MPNLEIKIVPKEQTEGIWPDLGPDQVREGQLESMAILEKGMESGKTSVMLKVRLADGSVAIVQTSADIYLCAAAALKGARERFGDPWDGI